MRGMSGDDQGKEGEGTGPDVVGLMARCPKERGETALRKPKIPRTVQTFRDTLGMGYGGACTLAHIPMYTQEIVDLTNLLSNALTISN